MSLLLTSERVFADLHDWIKWGEPEQVVLRQWEPALSLEYEFRGFVFKGNLNAISQYDHYCFYPQLQPLKDSIKERIFEFWATIHPHVGVDTYIVDFGYLVATDSVILIEISPFLTCTGPAMFSWASDRNILENGPFEFRLRTEIRPHIEDLVESNWKIRWETKIPKFTEFYKFAIKPENPPHSPFSFLSLSNLSLSSSPKFHMLFVYGTLKRGFHWNNKFLSNSQFLCESVSVDVYPLVVGGSGVPYLLGDLPGSGKPIKGEIWSVDDVTLQGLDEYEGTSKGYYSRRVIKTKSALGKTIKANVYIKTESSETLRKLPFLEEYSLQFHLENYKAIEHIMVKQQLYMQDNLYMADHSSK